MAERREKGLCFNCDEKFIRGHRCVYCLEVVQDDDQDMAEAPNDGEDPYVSLHALMGICTGRTMQVRVRVGTTELLAQIDPGSTHNFIQDRVVNQLGLVLHPRRDLKVVVANGEKIFSKGVIRGLSIEISNEKLHADFYDLQLDGFDMVLGIQWLRGLGPIIWDFDSLTMSFWHDDHQVLWHDVPGTRLVIQVQSCEGQDLMATLLTEFSDLFAEPTGLPPSRSFDHRIHLLPDTPPVVVRPYRYPMLQKTEQEQQCQSMLKQGIIHRSTSAYSSPVLLVKK